MRITSTSIPPHIAKAYGVTPAARVAPVKAPETVARVAPADQAVPEGRTPATLRRLIAGQVPGGIDFRGDDPAPTAPVQRLYRHPADQNAAATTLHAGRVIDLEG